MIGPTRTEVARKLIEEYIREATAGRDRDWAQWDETANASALVRILAICRTTHGEISQDYIDALDEVRNEIDALIDSAARGHAARMMDWHGPELMAGDGKAT